MVFAALESDPLMEKTLNNATAFTEMLSLAELLV